MEQSVQAFFSADGPLAQRLAGYESRADQVRMAAAVEALLQVRPRGTAGQADYAQVLVVEAETGVGKSLAYLVPAVFSGKRVVVSTATINLQDQLVDKEIPLLSRIIGHDIGALCVKGRQNYLCLHRWYQFRSHPQQSLLEDQDGERIEKWLETTDTGDRAELAWLTDRSPLWPRISALSHQCLGGECPESGDCFINRLRRKAGNARLLVVNHHLYFSDLALRRRGYGELLPRHEAVIFDEAHHLEQVATTFFGSGFGQYQVYDLVGDMIRQAEQEHGTDDDERLLAMAGGLKQRIDQFCSLFPGQRGRFPLLAFSRTRDDWHEQVHLVADGLQRCGEAAAARDGEGWTLLADRAEELRANLLRIAVPDEHGGTTDQVYWYERRERSITLSATPIHVAEDLRQTLYAAVPSCVMTSATLATGDRFDYFCQRLGLSEPVAVMQLKSPFPYRDRALVYVPENGFPEPAEAAFESAVAERIRELLGLSQGRALVLFTSFKAMDAVAEFLQGRLDYPILVQGTAARSTLLTRFRRERDSVLLAVASFWEGVDIPGESLSAVIIDKLPFEVPSDPVMQARMQAIGDEGGNPFFDFQVPRAVLTLRQGVGRLMRSSRDSGLIAIMDIRLFSKRYGKVFLDSLPPAPIVRERAAVAEFFARVAVSPPEQEV